MRDLENLIKDFSNSNYKIAAYGAPTKASLLLSMANLDMNQISIYSRRQ